jgi:hypothetical protein
VFAFCSLLHFVAVTQTLPSVIIMSSFLHTCEDQMHYIFLADTHTHTHTHCRQQFTWCCYRLSSIRMCNFVDVILEHMLFSPFYGIIFTWCLYNIRILCGLYLLHRQDCKSQLLQLTVFERVQHLCFSERHTVCNANIFCYIFLSNSVLSFEVLGSPWRCLDV